MKYVNNSLAWVLVASLLLVSVSGCMQSADVGEEEMVVETYTGVLSELPNATKQLFDATHSFETETGSTIYVRSLIYDLYDQLYEDALIRISGVPREVEGRKTLTVDRIEVLEENISEDEVEFEQYINQDLGISLEMPASAFVDGGPADSIAIIDLPGSLFIDKVYPADLEGVKDELLGAKEIKLGVDGVQGYSIATRSEDELFRYYLKRNNENFYVLAYSEDVEGNSDRNLAEEVTNSLRFIPFTDEELTTEEESTVEDEPTIDPVDNNEDNVDEIDDQSVSDAELENYRSLESRPLDFSMYYPKNWYYAQVERGYAFALEPVEDENWTAYIKVGDNDDVELDANWVAISKKVDGKSFTIYGPADVRSQLETMLRTLEAAE